MLFSAIKRENLSIARSLSSTVIGALVSPAVTRNESLAQGATFVSSLKHGLVKCEIFIFICPRLEEYVYVQEKEVRGQDEVSVDVCDMEEQRLTQPNESTNKNMNA